MSEFNRTLQTAADAEGTARLLHRVAEDVRGFSDRLRLQALAQRYTDYAAALRETVTETPADPEADQRALF